MWVLKKLSDGTTKYLISGNKLYTVGRKNCDFILENDASVSRKHCSIYIAKQSECPFPVSTITGVWVVDEQSKYGSFLKDRSDWVKINSNENKKLTNGSVIKFGLMDNIWSLEHKPVVACASGIPAGQKKKIESTLQTIDGFLRNAWCKECSLVIVNEITLTVKVVLALINGIPIVTPNYVEKLIESVKNQSAFPDYENYRPVIKESILDKTQVSLDTRNHRKELFKGLKFVIPTKKQLDTLKEVILSAGGRTELLSPGGKLERFTDDNVVIIQLPISNTGIPEDLCKLFKEINTFLKNCGRRAIPESEIAQAVAYSSREKFCNPKSTCFNLRIGERKQVDLGPVIVEETPITTEETRSSGFGVVASSATMYSETPLDKSIDSEPLPKTFELELNRSNIQKSSGERKRGGYLEKLGLSIEYVERKREGQKVHRDILKTLGFTEQQKKIEESGVWNKYMKYITPDLPFISGLRTKTKMISPVKGLGTHSPNPGDHEIQKKKARNKSEFSDADSCKPETSVKRKSTPNKSSQIKGSLITSYFQKQNKPPVENPPQLARQASTGFWDCDSVGVKSFKRKISNENDDSEDSSSVRKKSKILEMKASKPTTPDFDTPREVVQIIQESSNSRDSVSFPPIRKNLVQEDDDCTGYFGRDETSHLDLQVDDLNKTIFSLTIISPAFVKEDGSLIEPPSAPVNVKRFKKQKILSSAILQSLEDQDDVLSDGEWIEPHSDRLNISVGNDW